jgi:hypothetical protein
MFSGIKNRLLLFNLHTLFFVLFMKYFSLLAQNILLNVQLPKDSADFLGVHRSLYLFRHLFEHLSLFKRRRTTIGLL